MFLSKLDIRNINRMKRQNLQNFEFHFRSCVISSKIINFLHNFKAYKLLLYSDFDKEVCLDDVFSFCVAHKKETYYPKVLGGEINFYKIEKKTDFSVGYYGILEPKICNENTKLMINNSFTYIIFVPGVAFDIFRNRVGFGKGYYDKFLSSIFFRKNIVRENFFVIGVCYEFQFFKDETLNLLKSDYDFPMDLIITDKNIYC